MKAHKLIIMLSMAALIYSCSPINREQENQNVSHILSPNSSRGYEVVWEKTEIKMADNRHGPMIVTTPNILVLEGKLSSNSEYALFGFNTLDGRQLWQQDVVSSPAQLYVSGLILYRGTGGKGHIQAYDIENGDLYWETSLPGAHSIVDLYKVNNLLFANTNDDAFFVLSEDGLITNSRQTSDRIFFETAQTTYLGKSNAIQAKDKTSGLIQWHVDLANMFEFSPVFEENTIYLRTSGVPNNFIYSIDQTTGTINWQIKTNALSNLYKLGPVIYYLTVDGRLNLLDSSNGKQLESIEFSPPFELNGYGYIGGYYVTADPTNNVIVVSFGDSNQLLGIKSKP
jgi:outer membrane protein assembly factor BamB